ncbi:tRNA-dihydrouridine(47) synthase [NAD(P)(+)]-like isoform 2 [Mus musculus]|uniref:tRNA-dihydrouridine(47) synthase [NAD(P)(+)]-like isoform 2 n=1 Tax=Mus musculus TaxID=10090 RepID=UPI0003D6FC60|nr:tRNA-dihydrouridine(47) synthase [NAD(P)(+)]-like isoform 2 [Mus musculus]|eukprot:XP_006524225.1 PREDICTED: tRNA-dihydrouridine(47) synthase [NAD(P)(+)]-like isoform X2 [Mus musculus]
MAETAAESGGGGDSGVGACERGVAPIKAQYRTTKERFHEYLDGDKQEGACQEVPTGDPAEPGAKRIRLEDGQENGKTEVAIESRERQVPKRARGQNKSRPHVKPAHYDKDRLCPSFLQEPATPCAFGDRCRFLHDVGRYLETKPADLGPRCVLFETFGRCPFSMTCRFAGAHLGPEGQNLVQEEVVARCAQLPSVRNGLDRALQQQLRKRQVCFERAEQALNRLTQSPMPTVVPETTVAMATPKQNSCHAQLDTVGGAGTPQSSPVPTCGPLTDEDVIRLRPCEKKRLDISGKLYLAPLTTCGNLPFRRICKRFGADVTCGEMAVCTNLLQGQMSEWALLKRHPCEDIFGVQLEGAFPDTMTKCAELLNRTIDVDFVDINVGCPIDLVYKKGGGCALMNRSAKFQQIVRGVNELHGRSREQRYTRLADWPYIEQCAKVASPMPLFGNGDILSFEDANCAMQTGVAGIMVARGALLKPWLFTEIKEQRHWDISSSERLDILRDFTHYGLEHWGSDTQGVERTRRFLLEWLSFLCRYVPVGLLERPPQRINERPPYYLGRDYLETLMASQQAADWIRISEMLLGPVPPGFVFLPKHKANAYK